MVSFKGRRPMGKPMGKRAFQDALRNAPARQNEMATVTELCQRAFALQRSGRLPDAKALYGQLLTLAPDHFDALHQSGRLEHAARNYDAAEALLARAVKVAPRSAEAHRTHGMVLAAMGRVEEAAGSYSRSLAVNPRDVIALNDLGNAYRHMKRPQEALAA